MSVSSKADAEGGKWSAWTASGFTTWLSCSAAAEQLAADHAAAAGHIAPHGRGCSIVLERLARCAAGCRTTWRVSAKGRSPPQHERLGRAKPSGLGLAAMSSRWLRDGLSRAGGASNSTSSRSEVEAVGNRWTCSPSPRSTPTRPQPGSRCHRRTAGSRRRTSLACWRSPAPTHGSGGPPQTIPG